MTDACKLPPLDGCCVFVWWRVDGDAQLHQAILGKLRGLGARTAARLSKECTHIIFQRKFQANLTEKNAEDTDLRSIYDRMAKVEPPAFVVSLQWLQASADKGVRAPEARYLIRRPTEPIFLLASPTRAVPAGAKRKRKSLAARPRDLVETADIDDAIFSSSQQIRDINADDAPVRAGGRWQGPALGGVGEEEEEEEDLPEDDEPLPKAPKVLGYGQPQRHPLPSAAQPQAQARLGAAPAATTGIQRPKPQAAAAKAASRPVLQKVGKLAAPAAAGAGPKPGFKQLALSFVPAGRPTVPLPAAKVEPAAAPAAAGVADQGAPGAGSAVAQAGTKGQQQGGVEVFDEVLGSPTPAKAKAPASASKRQQQGSGQKPAARHQAGGAAALVSPAAAPGRAPGSARKRQQQGQAVGEDQAALLASPAGGKARAPASDRKQGSAAAAAAASSHVVEAEAAAPGTQPPPRAGRTPRASPAPAARPALPSSLPLPRPAPLSRRNSAAGAQPAAVLAVGPAAGATPCQQLGGAEDAIARMPPVPAPLAERLRSPALAVQPRVAAAQPTAQPTRQPDASPAHEPAGGAPSAAPASCSAPPNAAATAAPLTTAAAVAVPVLAPMPPRGRRGSRSCAGTPLGPSAARSLATPQGTPLGLLGGPSRGLTPATTVLVPRLKSQGSAGSRSAATTPGLPSVQSTQPDPPGAGPGAELGEGPQGGGPHQDAAQDPGGGGTMAAAQVGALTGALPPPATTARKRGRRAGLPPTPPAASPLHLGVQAPAAQQQQQQSPCLSFGGFGARATGAAAAVDGVTPGATPKAVPTAPALGPPAAPEADAGNAALGTAQRLRRAAARLLRHQQADAAPDAAEAGPSGGGGEAAAAEELGGTGAAQQGAPRGAGVLPTDPGGPRRSSRHTQLSPLPVASCAAPDDRDGWAQDSPFGAWRGRTRTPARPQGQQVLDAEGGRCASALRSELEAVHPSPRVTTRAMSRAVSPAPACLPAAAAAAPPQAEVMAVAGAQHGQQQPEGDGAGPQPMIRSRRRTPGPGKGAPAGQAEAPAPSLHPLAARGKAARTSLEQHDGDQEGAPGAHSTACGPHAVHGAHQGAHQQRGGSPRAADGHRAPEQQHQEGAQPEASTPRAARPAPGVSAAGAAGPGPGSAARTVGPAPTPSHATGNPMTSPTYHTRFQRKRFSRLGVDLDTLPPGQPFVLQPDGTVSVGMEGLADGAAAGGAGAGQQGGRAAEDGVVDGPAERDGDQQGGASCRRGPDAAGMSVAGDCGAGTTHTPTRSMRASQGVQEVSGAPEEQACPQQPDGVAQPSPRQQRAARRSLFAAASPLGSGRRRSARVAGAADEGARPALQPLPEEMEVEVAEQVPDEAPGPAAGAAAAAGPSARRASRAAAATPGTAAPWRAGAVAPSSARMAERAMRGEAGTAEGNTAGGGTAAAAPGSTRRQSTAAARAAVAGPGVHVPQPSQQQQQRSAAAAAPSLSNAASAQLKPAAKAPRMVQSKLSLRAMLTAPPPAAAQPTQAAAAAGKMGAAGPAPAASGSAAASAGMPGSGGRLLRAGRTPAATKRHREPEGSPAERPGADAAGAAPATARKRLRLGAQPAASSGDAGGGGGGGAAGPSGAGRGVAAEAAGAAPSSPPRTRVALRAGVRYLAHTCVDAGTVAALQTAVRQLGGARLCPPGYEDGRVTHLVLGQAACAAPAPAAPSASATSAAKPAHSSASGLTSGSARAAGGCGGEQGAGAGGGGGPRRTVKVLLGIANGARFVTPAWVADSLAAGRWLPEEPYRAQTPFADRADAVRAALGAVPDAQHPSTAAAARASPGPVQPARGPHAARSPGRGPAPGAHPAVVLARPLSGWQVAVHNPLCSGPKMVEAQARKGEMERLVVALGGRVVPPRSATLVVTVGAAAGSGKCAAAGPAAGAAADAAGGARERRPRLGGVCAPAVQVAGEEWFMDLAETHVWAEPYGGQRQ